MKTIRIQKTDKFVYVDDSVFISLTSFKWYLHNGYAARYRSLKEPPGTFQIYMHQMILSAPKGMEIDHIDGNKLNNLKVNLRACYHKDNTKNVPRHKDNTSGFKGIWKRKNRKKCWTAQIMSNGKKILLGSFYTKEEAAEAYRNAATKYHGPFARIDF